MTREARCVLLVLNYAAIVGFAVGWLYIAWVVSLGGPMRITALDRAGVIDRDKLRQSFPAVAENVRHDGGMWVAERERLAGILATQIGLAIAIVNVLVLHLARRTSASIAGSPTGEDSEQQD